MIVFAIKTSIFKFPPLLCFLCLLRSDQIRHQWLSACLARKQVRLEWAWCAVAVATYISPSNIFDVTYENCCLSAYPQPQAAHPPNPASEATHTPQASHDIEKFIKKITRLGDKLEKHELFVWCFGKWNMELHWNTSMPSSRSRYQGLRHLETSRSYQTNLKISNANRKMWYKDVSLTIRDTNTWEGKPMLLSKWNFK